MSGTVSIITRKFGLRPQEPGVKLNLDLFSGFERTVNLMIRHGIKLQDNMFEKDSLTAVKYFYDTVRKLPMVLKKLKETGFRERVRRCAAQSAYFAIQEYKNRGKVVSSLVEIILSHGDLSSIFNKDYPNDNLLGTAKKTISITFNGKYGSREYLKNMFLHVRNLVKELLKRRYSGEIAKLLNTLVVPADITVEVHSWARKNVEKEVKQFFRKLSRVLTERVKKILKNKRLAGYGQLDSLVFNIFNGKPSNRRNWNIKRQKWRTAQFRVLKKQVSKIALDKLAREVVSTVTSDMTPERLINLFFKHPQATPWVRGEKVADFIEFLASKARSRVERSVVERVLPKCALQIQKILVALRTIPWKWLKKPHFQSQAIPLGIDDGQVYNLDYKKPSKNELVTISLSFFPREQLRFIIHEPERFYTMLERGLQPKRGVLLKKPGGGLVICIPFAAEDSPKARDTIKRRLKEHVVASVDLGLKIFATVSIAQCRSTANGMWENIDRLKGDIARYFIDQRQISGKRDNWFLPPYPTQLINFKQKLVSLQKQSYNLQAKLKQYASKYPDNYRHKLKFWILKREWKRVWQKIHNIHGELARQLATRIVAIATYHGTKVIRLEDLSWAKHTGKHKAGYFLTTWQVHWFHANIQELIVDMASREGIRVELVDPRGTSNRCSRCGRSGRRTGKVFICKHCGFELHADLNAARNITIAPSSPTAIRGGGRCPLPPT